MPSLEQIAKGAKASGLTQKDFEARILANPRYANLSREEVAAAWSGGLKKKDQSSGIKSPGERTESMASPSLSVQERAPIRPTSVSDAAPSLSRQQGLSDLSKQKPASTKPRGEYDGLARPGRTPVAVADAVIAKANEKQMTNENELGQVRAFAGRELLDEIANITSKVTDDQAGPALLRNAKKVDDLYRQFSPDDSGSMFVRDQNGNTAIDPNALNNVFKFADAEVAKGVALKLREEELGNAIGNNATSRLGLSVLEMAFTLPDLIGNLALSTPYYLSRAMAPGFTGEFNPITTAFGDFADRNRIQTELGEIGKGFGEVRNELSRAEMVTDFGEERANLGIVGNFSEGTVEGFGAGMAMLGNSFIENLPQLAVTVIAPEIGLPMLATMSATQTYNEVLDNKDYSTADKVAYATVMGGVELVSEKILNADIRALRGAISDAGINLTTKQGKKELADLMFGKVPKSLRVAVEEPLEEAIVSATGEVMQAAIEGKPINAANIAEGALAGLGSGAGISILTNGISAIGKSTDSANIIKTQAQIKKLNDLMNDPSISEEEKAVLRPKLEQLIKDDKKIRENSADYYSKFTDEDVQETVKLNQIISEGIKNYSKMTTPEAKAEVAANVKAAMEAKKAIETKYDSQEGVDEIMSLPDDQVISFNVESLDQVPEQFRDRAEKKNDFEFKVRETILGLPFGKETTKVVNQGYSYTLTGKEAKDYAAKNKTVDTKYDSQEGQQVPGTQQTGEAPIQAQPVEEAGAEAAPAGGVVQEEVSRAVQEIESRRENEIEERGLNKLFPLTVDDTAEGRRIEEERAKLNVDLQELNARYDAEIAALNESKPVKEAVAEEVDTKEEDSEIEFYDSKIIDLESEIEIEKGNIKEAKAEIDQQIKDVRADKTLTPAERREKIEDLQAQKQDIVDDLTGNIEVYKEEIKAFKSDIKKLEKAKAKKLEKAKAAPVAAPVAQAAPVQPMAEPVVAETATAQEDATAETTQEAAPVKETKKPAGKVASSEEVASRIASSPSKARMYTAVKRAANSLKKLFPNAEYVFVDSNEEAAEYYKQNMKKVPANEDGTDKGRIIQNKNNGKIEIVINTSRADATTVYHELFHAAFFKSYAQDAATAIDFADRLYKVLATGTTAEREISKRVLAHTAKYKGGKQNVISEEFLSELAGILAADSKSITQGMAAKIVNFINNIAKKMGIGPVFTEAATTKEVVDFMNSFAAAAREGGNVTEKLAPKKDGKAKQPAAGNRLFNEPLKAVKSIADGYYQRAFGTERPTFEGTRTLDKERAKRISDAFDAMKHSPNDPEVAKAYKALAEETIAQYQAFIDAGYVVEINNEEPYANSQEMIDDLRNNKRIKIFSTESGFGDTPITDKQRKENPLLAKTKFKDVNGQPMLVNDLFRAVHDFFGHAELGNSFGPLGEENAWNVHARMFSPVARRAMTTETRGQNSYVNFSGVNQEADRLREKARKLREAGKFDEALEVTGQIYELTSFADQKVGLLPEEFSEVDDSDFVVTTAVFRPSSSKADKDIDIDESRAGFSRSDNFPSNTASAMDFDGETFITTQSDRLATGEQVLPNGDKITLRGGFGYPSITGYVWAASQLSKANELAGQINRQIKEKGYALVSPLVMGEESHKGNYTYFSAAMSLVNSAADKKKLSNKKFLDVVKKAAEIAGVDVSSVNAKTVKENTEILMDFFSVEGGTFQKRSSFVKALLGNTTKKGGVHKPNLPGVITSDQLADITADPFLKGLAGTGYVMSVIRVTKPVKTRETSAKEDGFAFHESYPAIIESTDDKDTGVELIVLDKAFAVQDVFPSFETTSGKVITLESVGGDVNKYQLFLGLRNIPAVTKAKVSMKPSTQEGPKLSPRSSKLNYDKKGFDANELASLPKSPMTKAKIQEVINSGTYAFMTAENPNNEKATLEENASYMAAAKAWLSKRGYKPTTIYGMYNNKENSFFIPDMSFKDAEAFRKKFKQESVAHSEALIYEETYQERIPGENSFNANYRDPKNNYYSVFKDKEGNIFGVSTTYADDTQPLSNFESRSSKAEEASEVAREVADQYYKNRGNVDQNWMQKLAGNVYSNMVRTPEQMEALRIKETRDSKTSRQALKIRRMAENLYSLIKNSGADAAALVTEYMSGPTAENIDAIENLKNGAKILDAATEMRAFLDQMSRQLVDGPAFAALNQELKEVILGNVGSYLKTSYRFWKDKNYKITDKAIKNAAAHVYDVIRAKKMGLLVKEGKSQQEIEEFLEATKEQMFREAVQQINDYVREVEKIRSAPKFKGSGMVTTGQVKIPGESFQKRKDIPAYIQELLGVEKDPQIRFIDTALALTNILYKGEMAAKMANAFGNDFFISDDVITREDKESGLYKMVKDEYSPLNRMWVPTEIFDVINNEDIYSADTIFGQRYYDLLKLSRKSKVLYNLPTWRKNITGGWQIIMANGILNPQFIKDLANRPAFTVMGKETEEMTQLLDEMAQYGLIGGDVNANVINGVDAMYSGIIRGDYSYTDKAWNWMKNKDKKLSERYSAIDDYTKMIIYRNKRDSFAKKLYGANYDTLNQTQQEQVRAAAAEETKQTTPTFSRLPPFYRALAKVPLGDFLSFKLESVRSLSMIVKTANDDIKKAMDPKLSAVQRAEYAKTGLAKLMGAAGALSLSYVIPGMIESALGFDEEETDDMKLLRPDWMSGDNLIVKRADSSGNVSVYDMTMEDTYGDVSSMIVNLSKGEFKEVAKIFSDALGVNMVVTMLFNLAEKKDQYGRPLFESYDSDMNSIFKVVKYLSKETIIPPSFYSSGRDAAYISEQTGENVYYLFGELALKRVVIRDYQYNMGQQFYFDAVDGAEGIKKDEQYTNLTGAEYEKRIAKLDQIKDKYEAIVRYGKLYDNNDMIKSAKSAIKKYYGKDEERYILYGQMK